MLDKMTSNRLKAVAFVCALLVVTIHSWSPSAWCNAEKAVAGGWTEWQAAIAFLLSCTISRIAVPCFFVMTGFFLSLNYRKAVVESADKTTTIKWYAELLKKRFRTIYVPFVIWNTVNLILCLLWGKYDFNSISESAARLFGWNVYISPSCMQFWYLQSIIIWVLLSLVFMPLLKSRIVQVIALAITGVVWQCGYFETPYAISSWAFFWLLVGTAVAYNMPMIARAGIALRKTPARLVLLTLFLIVIAMRVVIGVKLNRHGFTTLENVLVPLGVLAMFVNADILERCLRSVRSCFGLTFFIYAFHTIIISILVMISNKLAFTGFVSMLVKMFGAMAISVVVGLLMRRMMPKVLTILTGGRM